MTEHRLPASWTCTCGAINAESWTTCGRCGRPENGVMKSAGRILYSAGYGNLHLDAFCAFVERERLVVADVRLRPYSNRNPIWNQKALQARLGDRYVWIDELGNLNYKGGPIVLKDEQEGLRRLRAFLEVHSVVLLCVCSDPTICHRTVIVQRLAGEIEVRPLPGSLEQPARVVIDTPELSRALAREVMRDLGRAAAREFVKKGVA